MKPSGVFNTIRVPVQLLWYRLRRSISPILILSRWYRGNLELEKALARPSGIHPTKISVPTNMHKLAKTTSVAVLLSLVSAAIAQPPGGMPPWGGGGPGMGGPGMGGPPMMMSGGGSPWGGGGFGGRGGMSGGMGGFDPSQFLTRMDTNGNGMLDPEEAQGPARFMLDRMARDNPKIDITKPIPMSTLTEAFQRMRGGGGGGGGVDGRPDDELALINEKSSLVAGFSSKMELVPVPGFGAMAETTSSIRVEEQDLREAEDRIRRYDKNADSALDETELKEGRWGDTPMQYDRNKDGKLTKQELATRQARRRMLKGEQEQSKKDQANAPRKQEVAEEKKDKPNPFEKTASYRMTDSEGKPARPAGLPEWFTRNDINSDNQVSMNEFNRKWTDEVVEDFARFDTNRDGLITSRECLAAVKKGFIPGAISSAPATSSSTAAPSVGADSSQSAPSNMVAKPSSDNSLDKKAQDMRAWSEKKMIRLDKDGNKTLSPEEFKEGDFNQADLNKDGKIDLDEYAAHRVKK